MENILVVVVVVVDFLSRKKYSLLGNLVGLK